MTVMMMMLMKMMVMCCKFVKPTNRSIMPVKTFQETLQSIVIVNHNAEWLPESWSNITSYKVTVC